jgi:hypothetical protein
LFVRAYPRETQEMVFDAHDRAFALFKGTRERGIYDNMKTAVDTVFVGKNCLYNRRFLQMCSHYFVERSPGRTPRPVVHRSGRLDCPSRPARHLALKVNPDPVLIATEGALWGSIRKRRCPLLCRFHPR